jgi:hypothetical protein
MKPIHRCPTYYQLDDGAIRICFGDVCGTVSSWHLVPPKVQQLRNILEQTNEP